MKLCEVIVADAIVPELAATDRDGAIKELVTALATAGALPEAAVDDVVAALIKREQNGSTGFGKGVAVPHVKHAKVKKMAGTIGRSATGRSATGRSALRRPGPSARLQRRLAAQPRKPAATAPAGNEHRLQQSAKRHVPPVPAAEQHTRRNPGTSGRRRSGKVRGNAE